MPIYNTDTCNIYIFLNITKPHAHWAVQGETFSANKTKLLIFISSLSLVWGADQRRQFCRTVQKEAKLVRKTWVSSRPSDGNAPFKLFSQLLAMSSVSHCQLKQTHMSQTPVTGHHHRTIPAVTSHGSSFERTTPPPACFFFFRFLFWNFLNKFEILRIALKF